MWVDRPSQDRRCHRTEAQRLHGLKKPQKWGAVRRPEPGQGGRLPPTPLSIPTLCMWRGLGARCRSSRGGEGSSLAARALLRWDRG